jgi:hypothetical protein
MSEIPEDIRTIAQDVANKASLFGYAHAVLEIGRAILAERERATKAERDRWKPAVEYFERYCVDEADSADFCACGKAQHAAAMAFESVVRPYTPTSAQSADAQPRPGSE